MEWVTFTSNLPFWIAKSHGHLGQGPTGKEYTYYWKMHESGNFTLHFRADNGEFYADIFDLTDNSTVLSGLFVDHGSEFVISSLTKGNVYMVNIYDTISTNFAYPNDLDVQFRIIETEILLTPDINSLVYFQSQDPLNLGIEGQGISDITRNFTPTMHINWIIPKPRPSMVN
jgi:hypothetical protein